MPKGKVVIIFVVVIILVLAGVGIGVGVWYSQKKKDKSGGGGEAGAGDGAGVGAGTTDDPTWLDGGLLVGAKDACAIGYNHVAEIVSCPVSGTYGYTESPGWCCCVSSLCKKSEKKPAFYIYPNTAKTGACANTMTYGGVGTMTKTNCTAVGGAFNPAAADETTCNLSIGKCDAATGKMILMPPGKCAAAGKGAGYPIKMSYYWTEASCALAGGTWANNACALELCKV